MEGQIFTALRNYGLITGAIIMLIIECGFRSQYWANHFTSMPAWLATSTAVAFSIALAITCLGLLLLTAYEFAHGANQTAKIGAGFSIMLRLYIFVENGFICKGDWLLLTFLSTASAVVAVAELRIALSSYSNFSNAVSIAQMEARKAEEKERQQRRNSIGNAIADDEQQSSNNAAANKRAVIENAEQVLTRQNGYKPTRKELAEYLGVNTKTVYNWSQC